MKKVIIVVFVVLSIPFITALFLRKEYTVEKSIEISAPVEASFDYLKMLKNQDNFSVWAAMDTASKKTFKGEDGTVGFVSSWDSQNEDVGAGEQEILKIEEGEKIEYALRFTRPFESNDKAYFQTTAINDSTTKVTWAFQGKMSYPMNIMLVFIPLEEKLGNDFETGLQNLKAILEQ